MPSYEAQRPAPTQWMFGSGFSGQVEVPALPPLPAWALGATAEITSRADKAAKKMGFIMSIL